mgnify:CR=1 FL=1
MKTILYAALTANAMVAKSDGNSDWPSSEDLESFTKISKESGCVIMGRNTFDIFNKGLVKDWPNSEGIHIVLTSKESLGTNHPNIKLAKNPQEAIDIAEKLGIKQIVVCGGSKTFGAFMQDKLVNEVYLDIEPLMFGRGMQFFDAGDFEVYLELLDTKMLNKNTIQLHYKVIK